MCNNLVCIKVEREYECEIHVNHSHFIASRQKLVKYIKLNYKQTNISCVDASNKLFVYPTLCR